MKLFYFYPKRIDLPLIAGLIHLKQLSTEKIPSFDELETAGQALIKQPLALGVPCYLGKKDLVEIYAINFGNSIELAKQTIAGLHETNLLSKEEWQLVTFKLKLNWSLRIGWLLWQWGKLEAQGRKLWVKGMQQLYPSLVAVLKE